MVILRDVVLDQSKGKTNIAYYTCTWCVVWVHRDITGLDPRAKLWIRFEYDLVKSVTKHVILFYWLNDNLFWPFADELASNVQGVAAFSQLQAFS